MSGSGRILAVMMVATGTTLAGGCAAGTTKTTNDSCAEYMAINATPPAATADHRAASPANGTAFGVTATPALPAGCTGALPQYSIKLTQVIWTNPDPTDISISSANDLTNGQAVCLCATSGAVTLTGNATYGSSTVTKTVQLTCN